MPELPEVETVKRTIAPRIMGRRIVAAEFRAARVLKGDPDDAAALITGRKITGIERRGKFIVIALDGGRYLTVHLGMTGRLLFNAEPARHTRAIFTLDRGVLLFDDQRMFGNLEAGRSIPARVGKLGPEPLEVTLDQFTAGVRARRTRMKALLLDQRFLRGLGNIYVDESLHRAGIHPLAVAARLKKDRIAGLHHAVVEVLTEAIAQGGSSVSDYVDGDGRKGFFQIHHRVYQRTGEPCVACGTPIQRILVAQRGTHFCPKCQKR